jgi:GGDEF domain-containing protein
MITNDSGVKPPTVFSTTERRVALERRRRVAEMSREEMERELLTSEVTGLPNRRAFDEAGVAVAIAMCDVDGLKALNNHGYETGNAVLRAMADVLREVGLEAYHDKGDEFLCRGNHIEQLTAKVEHAKAILQDRAILVQKADGSILSIKGADFSYGAGKDLNEAELRLKTHKKCRQVSGEIARGELRGIIVITQKKRICTSTSGEAHPDTLDLR